MLSYCLKCKKKNTESISPKVSKTTNGKTMMLSKCVICGSKKSKFIKEQQVKRLLSNLGIRQHQFIYSACGPLTKHKQRIQKFK